MSSVHYSFENIEPAACALPVETLQNLALIQDAPPGVAESTLALLGRETVDKLVELGAAECIDRTPRQITIKTKGRELIDFCSEYAPAKEEGSEDPNRWTTKNHKEKLGEALKVIGHREE